MPRKPRVALITGVSGQDGSYLSEFLLSRDYRVFGLLRPHASRNLDNLASVVNHPQFSILAGDVTDWSSLIAAVAESKPDEIYNLAAQSFVAASWGQARLTTEVNFMGFLNLLEAVRSFGDDYSKRVRIYQASSSEMFGNVPDPQNEESPMRPRSPYGVSKLASHRMAAVFRESFGMFISCGICFNHESPRRGPQFVTRKIAQNVVRIKRNEPGEFKLGGLLAKRDWGYAKDYVEAMWLMLQADKPDDYVVASGESHSVLEFLAEAWIVAGIDPDGPYAKVEHDKMLDRPSEITRLRGDSRKLNDMCNWSPITSFHQLVTIMVEAEMQRGPAS